MPVSIDSRAWSAISVRFRVRGKGVVCVGVLFAVLLAGVAPAHAAGPTRLRPRSTPQTPQVEAGHVPDPGTVAITHPGYLDTTGRAKRSTAPDASPIAVGARVAIAPIGSLPSALAVERSRVAEIAEWNSVPGRPLKVGFSRPLPSAHAVSIDDTGLESAGRDGVFAGGLLADAPGGMLAWTAHARVADAERIRLHLSDVELPPGSAIWAYGDDGVPQGPIAARFATAEDGLWCPSVKGGAVWIEVQIPAESLARGEKCSFVIDRAIETFTLDEIGRPVALFPEKRRGDESCLVDVSCVPPTDEIANASRAIGRMLYVSGGGAFVCTGGLLNDQSSSGTPFFLTAYHCLSTQGEVASLEVWFDYKTLGCAGVVPDDSVLPKSFGGTLLVGGSSTDVTFIELADLPTGRFFFGWMVGDPARETMQRVANPHGGPQKYSETRSNDGQGGTCAARPLSNYLYEGMVSGGIAGGSSGSPVWIRDNLVVGQLFGTCGPTGGSSCDGVTRTVDGRFSQSFPILSTWLTPNAPSAPTNLRATKVKKKKLRLVWNDAAVDETRYEVAAFVGDDWVTIGMLAVNTELVIAKQLVPGATYRFGVRACRNSNCSAYAEVIVTTKGG
jgi:hypothetical protein